MTTKREHAIVSIEWNGARGEWSEWHWVCRCGHEEWNRTEASARNEFRFHRDRWTREVKP